MSHAIDAALLPHVDPAALIGQWIVLESNFPMWTRGARRDPRFVYGAMDRPDQLDDVVKYTVAGRPKTLRGIDTQDPTLSARFRWRGRGLLASLTSDWYVVHLDPEAGVMAIWFSRTLFTPAGSDLLARAPAPPATSLAAARAALGAIPGLGDQPASLVSLAGR